jgi:hypothetical protein
MSRRLLRRFTVAARAPNACCFPTCRGCNSSKFVSVLSAYQHVMLTNRLLQSCHSRMTQSGRECEFDILLAACLKSSGNGHPLQN